MKRAMGMKSVVCVALAMGMVLALSPARAEESIQSKVLTLVSKMSAEQQQALYDLLTKLNSGDAKAAAAPSPEKALSDAIGKVKEAAVKGDVDTVMALVADDFQQSQLGGKAALKTFFQGLSSEIAQYAKDTEISAAKATVKVDNGKASIDPVNVSGPWGQASLSFTAKLVNNEWKITGAELH